MVSFKYSFVLLISAASVALATVAQIEAQLNLCSDNATNWNNLLSDFPGSTTAASSTVVNVSLKITVVNLNAHTKPGNYQRRRYI